MTDSATPGSSMGSSRPLPPRVLIVDDEPELRQALVESLSAHGYAAVACGGSKEALALLAAQEFDLLLTDLMMPEMNGIDLLRAGQRIDPHLVGLMMTGQGSIKSAGV